MCEPMAYYREIWRHARKRGVRCHECGTPAKPGERYVEVTGQLDGWRYYRVCEPCYEILKSLSRDGYPCFGGVISDVLNAHVLVTKPELFGGDESLSPRALGHWYGLQMHWALGESDRKQSGATGKR